MWKFLKSKLLKSTTTTGMVYGAKNGSWDPKQFLFMPKHPAVKLIWDVRSILKTYFILPYEHYEEMTITVTFADNREYGMPLYHTAVYRIRVEQVDGVFIPVHKDLWERILEEIRLKQAYYFDDLIEYELDSVAGYPQELISAIDQVTNTYPPSFVTQ